MSERYLANENFPAAQVRTLRDQGDDVLHAAEILAGASDQVILQTALDQDRVLLTFDRDFGELVFHQHQPPAPGIVLFRLRQQPPDVVLPFLQAFFAVRPTLRGFFTVASPGQFRQTSLRQGPQQLP
jgi:predicted nuclease of predicted toxin-antitoxin system